MYPSTTVSELVKVDGIGVADAVHVLHRRAFGERHHLISLDALARALARVGSCAKNGARTTLGVDVKETKRLRNGLASCRKKAERRRHSSAFRDGIGWERKRHGGW